MLPLNASLSAVLGQPSAGANPVFPHNWKALTLQDPIVLRCFATLTDVAPNCSKGSVLSDVQVKRQVIVE